MILTQGEEEEKDWEEEGGGGREGSLRILCEEGYPQIDGEAKGSEEEEETLDTVEETQKGGR
jgi:hypothetical protein